MTVERHREVVRGLFAAINARQVERLGEFLAPDVVDPNAIVHGEPDEPGAAFEGIRTQLAAFDPYEVRIEDLVAEGDRVAARVVQRGTHTGEHPRMPVPTGRRFENEAMFVLTLADGLVTEIRGVSDRLGLFVALGWDWPA